MIVVFPAKFQFDLLLLVLYEIEHKESIFRVFFIKIDSLITVSRPDKVTQGVLAVYVIPHPAFGGS